MHLEGAVALVTGAAGGIGRVVAGRLAELGANVVGVDVVEPAEFPGEFVLADVSDAVGVESMIAFAEQRHSRIDVLVNLAGGYDEPVLPEASPEHWRRALDLNLVGTMLASQAAFHSMRGRGGAIVNVASSAGTGTRPYDGAPEYAAAKAGVVRLTTAFAECGGVRMNCVSPDWVATPAVLASLERMSPEERAAVPAPASGRPARLTARHPGDPSLRFRDTWSDHASER
jgi:NAD(P)-dependent dehydrogenase (short-subunit alcohol dehydrogenase family)